MMPNSSKLTSFGRLQALHDLASITIVSNIVILAIIEPKITIMTRQLMRYGHYAPLPFMFFPLNGVEGQWRIGQSYELPSQFGWSWACRPLILIRWRRSNGSWSAALPKSGQFTRCFIMDPAVHRLHHNAMEMLLWHAEFAPNLWLVEVATASTSQVTSRLRYTTISVLILATRAWFTGAFHNC